VSHLRAVSRVPQRAQNVPVEVKIAFVIDILESAIPLFENKNPTNPESTS